MKRNRLDNRVQRIQECASKNQNPREGIETGQPARRTACARIASKNQNPREGIETASTSYAAAAPASSALQKTKIPARGLKPNLYDLHDTRMSTVLQKTKIPARGLKPTIQRVRDSECLASPSKNQNPREGIETCMGTDNHSGRSSLFFKKPKSPRGD